MITRRMFGAAAAAAPLATSAIAKGSFGVDAQPSVGLLQGQQEKARTPKMSIDAARALVRQNPELMTELRDHLRRTHVPRHPDLDPDILSKKSWSLSYKVLVQRERLTNEQVNVWVSGRDPFENPISSAIHKLMFG